MTTAEGEKPNINIYGTGTTDNPFDITTGDNVYEAAQQISRDKELAIRLLRGETIYYNATTMLAIHLDASEGEIEMGIDILKHEENLTAIETSRGKLVRIPFSEFDTERTSQIRKIFSQNILGRE